MSGFSVFLKSFLVCVRKQMYLCIVKRDKQDNNLRLEERKIDYDISIIRISSRCHLCC